MKVGDLVTRHPETSHDYEGNPHPIWAGGIVIIVDACGTHVKVHWGDYGAFWCPVNRVELVSEGR